MAAACAAVSRLRLTVIEIKIQAADLLKWGEQLDEFCKDVPIMFSSVLNKLGNSALQTSTDYLSAQTGLDGIDVRNAIQIHEATPQDLLWTMDARSVTLEPSPNWARPWQAPGDNTFNQQQLLRVVTSGDGRVCEICANAAEKPWTVEDINAAAAKWKDFQPPHPVVGERSNLLHPNCRCHTVPWDASRQQGADFAGVESNPPVVLTGREIVETFATEVRGMLKGS